MNKFVYNLRREPNGAVYRRIIETSTKFCDTALLVVRDTLNLDSSGIEVLESLKPFVQQEGRETKWPGTELLQGESATVYRITLCRDSIEILKKAVSGLYSWQQPELPEDLCLLRPDGSPWLASTTHEGDSYFELTASEKDLLLADLPELTEYLSKES